MKAGPASAANGDPLLLGQGNTSDGGTILEDDGANTGSFDPVFTAVSYAGKIALHGQGGVGLVAVGGALNPGDVGEGVYASSAGFSGNYPGTTVNGVHGVCDAGGNGVWGESYDAGNGAGNGVYGSTNSAGASGVYGHNAGTGYGVAGRAESGTGTLGDSTTGVGVAANSQQGTALSATTAFGTAGSFTETGGGIALRVVGPAVFNRSGLVTIKAPAKSATVAVPGGLAATSLVLALLQNAVPGVFVASAVPNSSTGKVKINMNQAPPSTAPTAKVAWFVLG
jgi:hypothetical protein